MKKKWIVMGVVLVIVLLIGINVWNSQRTTTVTASTASLKEETMNESVMTPGVLKLNEEQYVYYQADKGEIDEFFVEPGDTVKKGDKLVSYKNEQLDLDKRQNQLQINGIYLELDSLKKQHNEIDKELNKDPDNEMVKDEHDQIKMEQQQKNLELEQALLQKESVENEIAGLIVKAEVDGTVVSLDENTSAQGQMAEKAMIRIGSVDDVIVSGAISEYDTLNIELDQPVTLTSDAVPDEEWEGKVSYISDLPEEEAQNMGQEDTSVDYPIEVTLNDEINLKPGFKMLIEITTSEKTVKTLPISAVIQEDDHNYVYIVEDGKAKRVEVKVGAVDTEKMEIKEGVTKEDKVIIDPSDEIVNGTEVKLK